MRHVKRSALAPVSLLFVLLGSSAAFGAKLDPGLEQALLATAPAEQIAISVTLRAVLGPPGLARAAGVRARQDRVLEDLSSRSFKLGRRYQQLSGFSGRAPRAAIEALARHPEVEFVYLDGVVHAALTQGTALIGAPSVHALGFTGVGINVAVLDTGIDTNHADLVDDLVAEQCFCDDHPSPAKGCCPGAGKPNPGPALRKMTRATVRPSRESSPPAACRLPRGPRPMRESWP